MQNLSMDIHLPEALKTLRQVWYAYAEGLLPEMTGTDADDEVLEKIDDTLPEGWTVSIMPDGTVLAGHPVWLKNDMTVVVCHIDRQGQSAVFQRSMQ
jgi:hypothetical protein